MRSEHARPVRGASGDGRTRQGARRLPGTGDFPIHIVQENGMPDLGLTVFANELRHILSDGSVRGYLREWRL